MHIHGGQNMQGFRVVGINYKKSDATVRGLFAVNQDQYSQLLATSGEYGISDFFVVSTCNRTEIYGFAESDDQLINFICSVCAGDAATFTSIAYTRSGIDAINHLYYVAAGLDSQILGDYEILGQIKSAVKFAKTNGFICPFTERLINSVLQASKAVKTRTQLSGGTVSVSFAAIQYIKKYIGASDVSKSKIVLIGTGKIGRVTCRNLVDYLGASNITLINRTEETAVALATELGLRSAPIANLQNEIADADIVLVSTNATSPVVLGSHLAGKGNKLVIDISVPCNVAVEAQALNSVTFVDVDMLSKIKDETLQKRKEEVPAALAIIDEHVTEFLEWCDMRKHVPMLKEMKIKLMGIPLDAATLFNTQLPIENLPADEHEEKVQKAISNLAHRVRSEKTPGCHYIQAINDFIA
jgi:glutamyl-tRNA reductase